METGAPAATDDPGITGATGEPAEVLELPVGTVPRGRRVRVGGRELFVRSMGEATHRPPLVLLHGLGATGGLNWAPCFEPLAERTQVVALDLRGHGRGARVGNGFRLADCADDVAALIRSLGPGGAVVAGYSMGGAVAQLLAHRHPDLVAGLILSATARDFRGRTAERLRFAVIGALAASASAGPTALAPAVIPRLPGSLQPLGWSLAEVRRHEPAALLAAAAALGRFTSRAWVGDLDVPAAVIVHRQDRLVPPHRQHKLADALPRAVRIEVDADHLGVARAPEQFVPAMLAAHDSVEDRVTRPASIRVAS